MIFIMPTPKGLNIPSTYMHIIWYIPQIDLTIMIYIVPTTKVTKHTTYMSDKGQTMSFFLCLPLKIGSYVSYIGYLPKKVEKSCSSIMTPIYYKLDST